jgi:hypothetical protein
MERGSEHHARRFSRLGLTLAGGETRQKSRTRDGHCRQRIEVGESRPVAGSVFVAAMSAARWILGCRWPCISADWQGGRSRGPTPRGSARSHRHVAPARPRNCYQQRLQTGRQQVRGRERARKPASRGDTSLAAPVQRERPDYGSAADRHHALLKLVRTDAAAATPRARTPGLGRQDADRRTQMKGIRCQNQMIVTDVDDIMRFRATASEDR